MATTYSAFSDYRYTQFDNDSVHSTEIFQSRNQRKKRLLFLAVGLTLTAALVIGLTVGLHKSSEPEHAEDLEAGITVPRCFSDTPPPVQCPWQKPPVILISLDGFRADYLQRHLTPTLQKIRECGIHAPYMRSVYPTLTFPNHYSIATGLYPESHGIVNNAFYDQFLNDTFVLGAPNTFKPEWWKGEPIWLTAKRQNVKSAAFFWVGSDVAINGSYPDYYFKYNGSVSYEQRINQTLKWLELPENDRPGIIVMYFNEPDHIGHSTGPQSSDVNNELKHVDGVIKSLIDGLVERNLDYCVNIMIVADHGMTNTSCDREVYLKCFMEVNKTLIFDGTIASIDTRFQQQRVGSSTVVVKTPDKLLTEDVEESLECQSSHYRVFTKDTLPKRFHYTYSDRIGDVLLDVQDEWLVYGNTSRNCLAGNHGYDNLYKNMEALFLAFGPSFKQNLEVEPFENIELYNLLCFLLGVVPAKNNGTFGSLHHFLTQPPILDDCFQFTQSDGALPSCACHTEGDLSGGMATLPCVHKDVQMNGSIFEKNEYTTLYSSDFGMPVAVIAQWTQEMQNSNFNLKPRCSAVGGNIANIYQNFSSPSKNIVLASLIPVPSSTVDCDHSSPLVPMYDGFVTGIWHHLWNLINSYASTSSHPMQVSVGPIFDWNYNSLFDPLSASYRFVDDEGKVPLPSHFYVSLARCQSTTNAYPCQEDIEHLNFILPHVNSVPNCLDYQTYLLDNVARIKDIELETGLDFLNFLSLPTSIRLKVQLPTQLWQTSYPTGTDNSSKTVHNDSTCVTDSNYMPLLLISLDGFRADYLKYNVTPNIFRLIQEGVHAPRMLPAYPSLTFPNHYSIITGLYPESHGIIDNTMFDISLMKTFGIGRSEASQPYWYGGDPMWHTVERQGKIAASYFWVGSDVAIEGGYPTYYKKYNESVEFGDRVKQVLEWLALPGDKRPDFITLYFEEPDHTGHDHGPAPGPEMIRALKIVDDVLGQLMDGLKDQNLYNKVNILLVSDHGMASRSCNRVVKLTEFLTDAEVRMVAVFTSAAGRIANRYNGSSSYTLQDPPLLSTEYIINKTAGKNPHLAVYEKSQLPKRMHYANNIRIDDIIVKMEDEWVFARFSTTSCSGGAHGWDNRYQSMSALFIAHGPAFKAGLEVPVFENIELYNLISDVLNITASPNNGTRGSLYHILNNPPVLERLTNSRTCEQATVSQASVDAYCSPNCSHSPPGTSLRLSPGLSHHLTPTLINELTTECLSYEDHTTVYSSVLHMPLWSAFPVTNNQDVLQMTESCLVPISDLTDHAPPVHTAISTSNWIDGVTIAPLFTTERNCRKFTFSSEAVPMTTKLKEDLWSAVWQKVKTWTSERQPLTITVGPIFDYNFDGLADEINNLNRFADLDETIPLPSHYFMVLARCQNESDPANCTNDLDLLSFILPQEQTTNEQDTDRRLLENVARVRDVELLTGLNFFPGLDPALSARLRTHVPTALWNQPETASVSTSIPSITTSIPTTTSSIPFTTSGRKPGSLWLDQSCPPSDHADGLCLTNYHPVLLVSMDGFRPDYLHRGLSPVMDRLVSCGVHAPYMRSVYPTKTFPNHYSIVTGLYPESHGIIDNSMFDVDIGQAFSLSSATKNDPRWWGGDPLWITSKQQNVTSASYFWVGSDVPIKNEYPNLYEPYNSNAAFTSRVEQIIEWMLLPAKDRPHFLTMYFDEPDHTAHDNGPFTPAVDAAIEEMDSVIGELMDGLYQNNLHHCVNLILVSDHGFSSMSCDNVVELNSYINSTDKNSLYYYLGPFGRISNTYHYDPTIRRPSPFIGTPPLSVKDVQDRLNCVNHMKVYAKTDLPKRHHYSNNARIDNLLLDLDMNWTVSDRVNPTYCTGGNHGWDNTYKSMNALFVGYGPAFRNGETVEAFENIELYNMISDILGIIPSPNNGTEGSLDHLLWKNFNRMPKPSSNYSTESRMVSTDFNGCNCTINNTQLLEVQNNILYLPVDTTSIIESALPFGEPLLLRTDQSVEILYRTNHVTAFSKSISIPLWVSSTVSPSMLSNTAKTEYCLVLDSLAMNDLYCDQILSQRNENVTLVSLLPRAYDFGIQAALMSNQIPMREDFKSEIWQPLQDYLGQWSSNYHSINIISGPVYDIDSDGLADTVEQINNSNSSMPTGVFVVVSRCGEATAPIHNCSNIRTLSFILSQVDSSRHYNCQTIHEYLKDNEARVRDIELITGLHFFPNVPFTKAVAMRTYLPSGLWTVTS